MNTPALAEAPVEPRTEFTAPFYVADDEPGGIYRRLGVEPIINCAGVRTNYGGSNPSDEVLAAMAAAARAFVDLDELAEGVGQRLAQLTQAEWGTVTAGTAAALALSTAACIAGNDPELMLRLPDTRGLPNQVLIPEGQRFAYDNAIRMAGAQIVTVADVGRLDAALSTGAVVMVCLLGRADPTSLLPLRVIAPIARRHGVPILVDAAGLQPGSPDPWLAEGADLVAYSGGKYLRGPQSTGLLLGSKRLCQAAWLNGAPHQAFGRPMKVGKEEIVGALVALEQRLSGSSDDRQQWRLRLQLIARRMERVPSVSTSILTSPSVTAERLQITWDQAILPITAEELRIRLLAHRPRILLHDFWSTENSLVIDPVNIEDSEAITVAVVLAEALVELGSTITTNRSYQPSSEYGDVSGIWRVTVQFLHGRADHRLELHQTGSLVHGFHTAHGSTCPIDGVIRKDSVFLTSRHIRLPMSLFYTFQGLIGPNEMTGRLQLGAAAAEHEGPVFAQQFGEVEWTATRHP